MWDSFARCARWTNSLNLKYWISNNWTYWVFEETNNLNNIKRKNLTSLRSDSETMCCLFLRFQVSKVSLAKHLSNGTRYGQKSSADLGIINNFWQKYFTESTLKADNSPSPSFPRCFSWLLHWTRLRRLAWAKKYQRNFGVD